MTVSFGKPKPGGAIVSHVSSAAAWTREICEGPFSVVPSKMSSTVLRRSVLGFCASSSCVKNESLTSAFTTFVFLRRAVLNRLCTLSIDDGAENANRFEGTV